MSVGTVDRTMNTLEYFVHHEDIRRAAPDWSPRELTEREQRALWKAISVAGKGLVRPAGVPVELRWVGEDGEADRTATLRPGSDPVVVAGAPAEIVMFCFSRPQNVGLELSGPPASRDGAGRGPPRAVGLAVGWPLAGLGVGGRVRMQPRPQVVHCALPTGVPGPCEPSCGCLGVPMAPTGLGSGSGAVRFVGVGAG